MEQSKKHLLLIVITIILGTILYAGNTLAHEEAFSNNNDGWFTDDRMVIRNGRYEFSSSTGAAYSWRTKTITDGAIEVEATWTGGLDSHGYGMIFRLEDEFNYYFFWIAAQGYYIAGKAVDGQASVFRSWTYDPVIVKRGTNTLRVTLDGPGITYSINGKVVSSYNDSSFLKGGYGFYTQKDVSAAFDNFKAWESATQEAMGKPGTADADIVMEDANFQTSAVQWRGDVGKRIALSFEPGGQRSQVWGTDIYTDDSSVLSAAVHRGLLSFDRGGTVVIEMLGSQDSFEGSTRNGVGSDGYGYWPSSFTFVQAQEAQTDETGSGPLGFWQGATDVVGSRDMQLKNDPQIVGGDLRLEGLKKHYALIPTGDDFDLTDGYTVSLRIKFNSWYNWGGWADNQYLVEYHTDADYSQRHYIIRVQVTGDYDYASSPHELSMAIGPIRNLVRTNVTPTLGTWHTISASYDGQTMRMYLDGKSILAHPYRYTLPKSSLPMIIDAHHHGDSYAYHADVDIDSLLLFDRVLNDDEITILAQSPNIGGSTTTATVPVQQQPQSSVETQQPQQSQNTSRPMAAQQPTFVNVAAYDQTI